MSRSGYTDESFDEWRYIRWRGAVKAGIRSKRGQAFLKEMLKAMEALPEPKLISHELEKDGAVCAIGSVGKFRNIDMSNLDPEDYNGIAKIFGVSQALVREIEHINDDDFCVAIDDGTRFRRVKGWLISEIRDNDSS